MLQREGLCHHYALVSDACMFVLFFEDAMTKRHLSYSGSSLSRMRCSGPCLLSRWQVPRFCRCVIFSLYFPFASVFLLSFMCLCVCICVCMLVVCCTLSQATTWIVPLSSGTCLLVALSLLLSLQLLCTSFGSIRRTSGSL